MPHLPSQAQLLRNQSRELLIINDLQTLKPEVSPLALVFTSAPTNYMNTITVRYYITPCGVLKLGSFGNKLCLCDWQVEKHRDIIDRRLKTKLKAEFVEGDSEILHLAAVQLDGYFTGRRQEFTVPLMFVGTDFQKTVWNELLIIPYGQTVSYGEIARRIGMPKAVRAVANANGANSISIFAPCHRVIGSDNSLTGYGGGINAKRALLELEAASLMIQ